MSGAVVGTALVGAVVSTGVSMGAHAIFDSGSGGSVSQQSGGGGGGSGLSVTQQQYAIHGPHPSTTPMSGQAAPKPTMLTAPKAGVAPVASPRSTPTQSVGAGYAAKDYNGVWADRLSRYLDYNTRNLG